MEQVSQAAELRSCVLAARKAGKKIGFVPTMGFLHAGHLSLVEQARRNSDFVVVSIFVNPTQFNDKKDFEAYPIDIERDAAMLEKAGADLLFLPATETVFGTTLDSPYQTWVNVESLSLPWEGAHRPGHFRGVSTVVSILFNLVQADCAVFGEKDFQQLRLIEQMVADLKRGVEILRGELIREPDGLAMSSRNVRLSQEDRRAALAISRGLLAASDCFKDGERRGSALIQTVEKELKAAARVQPEYVAVASEHSLEPVNEITGPTRILVAVKVGAVRLIDNVALRP